LVAARNSDLLPPRSADDMTEPLFAQKPVPMTVAEIAALTDSEPLPGVPLDRTIDGVAALDQARPRDLAFIDQSKYAEQLTATRAGVCLIAERLISGAPAGVALLRAREPYRAFVTVARKLFEQSLRPSSLFGASGTAPGAIVHSTARLEAGATVDPGAVIGPRAEIGSGTTVAAGAVIGPDVRVGRGCAIGAGASVTNTIIGDRVILHPGCRIGQDGFGFVMGAGGHLKVPQIGRVIIQDDVEIGAGTTIDRGALRDTVIGEGTKIDNLVQIAHNVTIGRHCVIVAQAGIAGSATLGDYVVLGARVGIIDHATVGEGAHLAAASNVHADVPPGARYGGTPAKPVKLWFREMTLLQRMAERGERSGDKGTRGDRSTT
jgi:UDP-3-O-[3-hydroxymyristoyl] glucosamine N-acyltransferase